MINIFSLCLLQSQKLVHGPAVQVSLQLILKTKILIRYVGKFRSGEWQVGKIFDFKKCSALILLNAL
jgi:hypothetical protein